MSNRQLDTKEPQQDEGKEGKSDIKHPRKRRHRRRAKKWFTSVKFSITKEQYRMLCWLADSDGYTLAGTLRHLVVAEYRKRKGDPT